MLPRSDALTAEGLSAGPRAKCFALLLVTLLVAVAPVGVRATSVRSSGKLPPSWTSSPRQGQTAADPDLDEPRDQPDDEQDEQVDEPSPPWYERMRFSGDFRARYEGFYQPERSTRNRTRMRLRLRLDADVNNDARFHLQISSGDPGTPASTNQTFTKFFQPKPLNLDRAYVAYNPQAASALTLGAGKFPAPVTRTQMTFDDDLNYEGGWERVTWSPRDGIGIDVAAMQTAVNEVSRGNDSYMLAGYGAVTFDMGPRQLQVSAANYGWGNVDPIAQAQASGELTSILTNQVVRDVDGTIVGFASRFNVVDVIVQATIETSRPDYPLRFLAEYARNTRAANDRDSGYWLEVGYGEPDAAGSWGATYTYGWVEQDVTLSAFVFSDMPGTNLRLNMIETSYVPTSGLSLDVTLHLTKRLFVPDDVSNALLSRLHVGAVIRF